MHNRTPPPDRVKQKRYRARLAQHRIVVPVEVDECIIEFLVRRIWLKEPDSHKRAEIGAAIARALAEAAQHDKIRYR